MWRCCLAQFDVDRQIALGTERLVVRIGHLGDGIVEDPAGPMAVPYTVPGDSVRWNGATWDLAEPGPNRIKPPCPSFGSCGGCSMQHVKSSIYAATKHDFVVAALQRQGLNVPVEPLKLIAPHSRRRATFAAVKAGAELQLGFHKRNSDEIVGIDECQILRPRIRDALPAICELLKKILANGAKLSVIVTEVEDGLDLELSGGTGAPKILKPAEAEFARKVGVLRVSSAGEILMLQGPVQVKFGGIPVDLPLSAFLQASVEAEEVMRDIVQMGLSKINNIADIYAGLGTFTFGLARRSPVTAFEGLSEAVENIKLVAKRTQGLRPIKAVRRDLSRSPLAPVELKGFNGLVLDPPRSGAEAQARSIAASKVEKIVYVSCSPATFARDARIICGGGYRLLQVTPIDQFLWSHHVELVGVFERAT